MEHRPPSKTMVFPGGLPFLNRKTQWRKKPFGGATDVFAQPFDLEALKTAVTRATPAPQNAPNFHIALKIADLSAELQGEPQLVYLHALMIAMLRHDDPPPQAAQTFHRIWREQGEFLLENLDYRWIISALITFGDHGETENQRLVGACMGVFANMVKLYESERLFSAYGPMVPFASRKRQAKSIFLDQSPLAIFNGGDMDRNIAHHLWTLADGADPVMRPLALAFMDGFNGDQRSVFRRMRVMREVAEKQQD